MKIAVVNSNVVSISKNTRKGSEIFAYILIKNLAKYASKKKLEITAFASGDSKLPVKIESVNNEGSYADKDIGVKNHKIYELALLSKAFAMQKKFDLYHANIGNGNIIIPFAPFVNKPIIITMHGSFLESPAYKNYFSIFKNLPNVFFVSISDAQRKPISDLNYIRTIYHGIDCKKNWKFNPKGDEYIVWAGRAVPEKGANIVLKVVRKIKKKAKLFPMIYPDCIDWLREEVIKKRQSINHHTKITIDFDLNRLDLACQFQTSKLFLNPAMWEEPFGLVMIESMACGTPVVAYARGSVPEIIKDGETGFIVNPSDDDIRGNWIVKKTGIDGLCEAAEKIYSMPDEEYYKMRLACRRDVEERFTVERMIKEYVDVYEQVVSMKKTK